MKRSGDGKTCRSKRGGLGSKVNRWTQRLRLSPEQKIQVTSNSRFSNGKKGFEAFLFDCSFSVQPQTKYQSKIGKSDGGSGLVSLLKDHAGV